MKNGNNLGNRTFEKYRKELDSLKEDVDRISKHELDFVFNPKTEAWNNISLAKEHLYNFKVQDLDVTINIALNLVSFSLALLIAFVTVPLLGGNWIIILIPLLLSSIILICLISHRRKQSAKLTLAYLEGLDSNARRLFERSERHMDYGKKQKQAINKRLQEIKEKIVKKSKK